MNNWIKTIIVGNLYCLVFLALGALFKFNWISIANGLFYSIAIFVIVGLIAMLNPRKTLVKNGEEIKRSTLKERLTKGNDMISKGYRLFLYCFIISLIIAFYSYFIYEVGARTLGIV
ncbi:MAG: hypothetical protein MR639_08695 [Clostridium sp.]|uniref:hypothetical protein n=1 Tax=Clostridium sp. TaxID=1506 RepID=UPI002A85148C|nr:hypothetical protein [Clostridium sp.]MDY5099088.1 hypothetical protein [Clostridium sp.]